jgi:hypothetical protein
MPGHENSGNEAARPRDAAKPLCFIAAGAGADFSAVQEALRRGGWESLLITDLPVRAASFAPIAEDAINRADLVVGLLSGGSADQTVLFELGLASALQKPTIVVAASGVGVPDALRGLPVVTLAPGSDVSLDLALRHARHWAPTRPTEPSGTSAGLGPHADELIAAARSAKTEVALIEVIARALELSGATVVEQGRAGDGRFDIAVWSPELEVSVGNPLLIQVKRQVRSSGDLERATDQVLRYLDFLKGSWAMVVYGDGPSGSAWEADIARQPVLVQKADDLVAAMRDESFAELVRRLRNQRSHSLLVA